MRQKIVAGDWKMHKTLEEGEELAKEIKQRLEGHCSEGKTALLFPPYIHLAPLGKFLGNAPGISFGAQNCHQEEEGAYTGEISAGMIASTGARYVIIGHSERRHYFGEDNGLLAKKCMRALRHDLRPVYCCGEGLDEREAAKHFDVVARQIEEGLFHLEADDFSKIIIAYEPVWAIGTGKSASPEEAQEMHAFIRQLVKRKYGTPFAENLTILYGGSVKPANAAALFSQADIDGGLIGGASLRADDFEAIFNAL